MSRQKMNQNDKKREFSVTINEKLFNMLDEYMMNNEIKNRSRYIEYLVKEDMLKRCENIKNEFE